jgi:Ubiquitin carboxyl-terminal hydrolase
MRNEVFRFGSLDFPSIDLLESSFVNKQSISPVRPGDDENNTTTTGMVFSNNLLSNTNVHANGVPESSMASANGAPSKLEKSVKKNEAKKDFPKVQANGVQNVNCGSFIESKLVVTPKNGKKESKDLSAKMQQNGVKVESVAIDCDATAEVVLENEKKHRSTTILPRGLVNTGNTCFLNASLQALLSCSPFVEFLQDLRDRAVPKVCT